MANIQHGTLTGYTAQACRCGQCTAAQNRYNARRRRLIAYGQWEFLIDAEPTRQHVQHLRAVGLGLKRISAFSGISDGAITRLIYGDHRRGYGPTKRVHQTTAAALQAVRADLDTLAGGARIDATGTRRRVQALVCLGWSLKAQAQRAGLDYQYYARIPGIDRVTVRNARAVRAVYDDLSMSTAPDGIYVARTRRMAARKGYVSPLAWDDDTIDDPAAAPDLGVRVHASVALLENFEELTELGYTSERAAERLGVTSGYLTELRRRARARERVAA